MSIINSQINEEYEIVKNHLPGRRHCWPGIYKYQYLVDKCEKCLILKPCHHLEFDHVLRIWNIIQSSLVHLVNLYIEPLDELKKLSFIF